jgi:dienelactone hydrolase
MNRCARLIFLLALMSLGPMENAFSQDLSQLFAAPTEDEISAVAQDWASRTPDGTDFLIERTAELDGFTIARVSFMFEGLKQYAFLRYPRNYMPNGNYPLLMVHHGGTSGFYYTFPMYFDEDYPTGCLADECIVLVPTYRGEVFNVIDYLSYRTSEGEKSVWDRDCDDAMALLTAAIDAMPQINTSRLYSWGRSRGAGVAYHMALRDPRLYRSEVFFGPTDFFQDNIELDIQATLDGGPVPTNTLSIKVWDLIVTPWLSGEKNLDQARALLIGWSSLYFIDPTVSMQIHHGEDDENIPVFHGENFAAAMNTAGAMAPDFELFTYPGAGHTTDGLYGHEERVEEYLCLPHDISRAPDQLMVPTLEAWPNPFAKTVTIQSRASFRDSDPAFTLGSGSLATGIQIFDMRGRLVRSLVLPATGEAQWDGTDLSGQRVGAGIYLMEKTNSPGVPLKVLLLP